MGRIARATAIAATVTAATSSLLLAPVAANASGPYTLSCSGASPVPIVPTSSVTCTRSGTPSDDDGAYTFAYNAPLTCGAAGTFTVAASGPEGQIAPGNGSDVTAGPIITATFSYLVLDTGAPPPVEQHNVVLNIDCSTGITTGSLSE